jgi:hypothetical protein
LSASDVEVLPVGHPARPAAARAVSVTAVSAVLFAVFAAVTTQVHAVRVASPWQDDPYDAVVTFTMFFVPGLSAVAALRVLLCRRARPLPVYRVDQLLRAALLVLVLIDLTVLADWTALVLRADRPLWSGRTPLLVLGLVAVTVVTAGSHAIVRRARTMAPPHRSGDGDWLGDIVVAATLLAGRTGDPARLAGLRRILAAGVRFTRAHFVGLAALGSIAAGVLVVAGLAIGEGTSDAALLIVEAAVFAGGTFGFVMVADAWLQLAASPAAHMVARVGATAAALALPLSLALRDLLWSATGHSGGVQTVGQLAAVTATSAAICGVAASVVAYAVHSRARRG